MNNFPSQIGYVSLILSALNPENIIQIKDYYINLYNDKSLFESFFKFNNTMDWIYLLGVIPKAINNNFFSKLHSYLTKEEYIKHIKKGTLNTKQCETIILNSSSCIFSNVLRFNDSTSINYLFECIFSGASFSQIMNLGDYHSIIFKKAYEEGYICIFPLNQKNEENIELIESCHPYLHEHWCLNALSLNLFKITIR